jgi:hypothetical protein
MNVAETLGMADVRGAQCTKATSAFRWLTRWYSHRHASFSSSPLDELEHGVVT